ncbi:MAG: DNA polymerase I [Proteobacteria bacterium]|nr:DNA polymerase I [Pseudomonadota bacterium]
MADKTANRRNHIYLIDGSGYIFRAYYALGRSGSMTRSDGTPMNAVVGFCNMLFKLRLDLMNAERPTHLAVIFDKSRHTFRNEIYPEYKAHRPPAPEDLVPQFPIIREATEAFNIPMIEMEGFEADDVIATYARLAAEQGYTVTVVSSDKDLMQLVGGPVEMYDPMKNLHIGPEQVVEKFGVGPDKVIEVQALAGDAVDNVPGVPGIGVKTAALLINEYGDLETLLARAGEIKQPKRRQSLLDHADDARLSRILVTLRDDVPVPMAVDELTIRAVDPDLILPFIEENELKALKVRVLSHLGADFDPAEARGEARGEARQPETAKAEYECVTTLEALDQWIERIYEAGIVAVDTETTSLNAMAAELVGISLSVEPGRACYIPLRHRGGDGEGLALTGGAPEQLPVKEVLARLRPMLVDPGVLKIGQNIKYDLVILANEDVRITPFDDTMLISYVLETGLHGHGMDALSELHLGLKPISFKEVAGVGKKQITFDLVPLDKAVEYAAEDADITLRLHRLLKPRLAKEGLLTVYETLERPLAPVLARMERHGIKVDQAVLQRLSNDFAGRIAALETEIHKLAGRAFNVASPKQLGEVLFDEMGLEGGKRGKTGAWSTGAAVLEDLAGAGHELPKQVLGWRQLAKLKSTYTDALQKEINRRTGRVHTSYSLAATTTGRLASSDPNLQNIPIRTEEGRKIRTAFVAEQGHVLLSADYSQIELRLLAHIAGIDALKDAFHAGLDIHAMTASEVFGVPIEGMDPMTRRRAKAINFGIIYGISAFGLANQLSISRGEAKSYIETYFERFPGIRTYMDRTIEACRETGYVETIFGRRCHMRNINDKNPMQRAFGERAAINAPIQGSAADVIRRAMIRMEAALEEAGLGSTRMLLQVHDELIFEVPESDLEAVSVVVSRVMAEAPLPVLELSVPLVVDCGSGANWDEAH